MLSKRVVRTGPARRNALERLFGALADGTRLRLLNLVSGGEICVCHLTTVLRESQPNVSRHLAYLRAAGLVEARRDGRWMHYRAQEPDDPAAAAILKATLSSIRGRPQMERDRAMLDRVRAS